MLDEEVLHKVKKNPDGRIIYRMSHTIGSALRATLNSYAPEYSKIQAPVLSIYAIPGSEDLLAPDYMTEEQQASVVEFFDKVRPPLQQEFIEQFRRDVPRAKIMEIPKGHHYCFIKQEELVFEEMRKFLLP